MRGPAGAVLVRVPNWIGDAVMSLGALRELRRIVGSARMAVAGRPWVTGIFEESGVADEVIPIERRSWLDVPRSASALRRRGFETAVLFQNAFEAALLARLARIPRVVGYPTDGRRRLLTDAVPLSPDARTEHQSRYYMHIAAGLERALVGETEVDPAKADTSLRATDEMRARGREILDEAGISPTTPLVVLNPGATNSRAKQWLPERFAAVGDALVKRLGARIAIVGSAAEAETALRVAAAMVSRSEAAVLAGRTTIRELIGVMSHAVALVSNDTGPAHLGAALGVATVTIFGPTEHFATHPIGPRAVAVDHPVDCSPCMLRDCPIDHRCMTRLEVETVLGALEGVLNTRPGGI